MIENIFIQKHVYDEPPELRNLHEELQRTIEQKAALPSVGSIRSAIFLRVDRIVWDVIHTSELNGIYF